MNTAAGPYWITVITFLTSVLQCTQCSQRSLLQRMHFCKDSLCRVPNYILEGIISFAATIGRQILYEPPVDSYGPVYALGSQVTLGDLTARILYQAKEMCRRNQHQLLDSELLSTKI